jgi:hypothetical protein
VTFRSSMPMRLCLAVAVVLGGSCGGGGSSNSGGGTPPSNCQDPLPIRLSNPRFSTDLLPMFQATCGSASSSCHGAVTVPSGHFSWATGASRTAQDVYNDVVNVPPANSPSGYMRIKPGDVAHSWVIEKVSSDQPGGLGYGARMPYAGVPLCQTTIDNLKTWVQNGALF